jgi:Amt family ammonium transporter
MGIQLVAVLFIFAWTFTIMGCYFFFLNTMGWFRIDPLEEEVGMDISRKFFRFIRRVLRIRI